MNVNVEITVGNFSCEATITECGPDAVGDTLRQVATTTLSLVGGDAITAAAMPADEVEADDAEG